MSSSSTQRILDALVKARTYCNYRERCHKEVREKLYSLGLFKNEVDEVIMQLMDENLLNEERFAKSYARGYFYQKHWGKYRIKLELRNRQIHDNLISLALKEIEEEDYTNTIQRLIQKKAKSIPGNVFERKQKVSKYLQQKGYSYSEIAVEVSKFFHAKN